MNNFKCIKQRCYSPVACGGFGYCRDRNDDGCPMTEAKITRLRSEEAMRRKEPCELGYKAGLAGDDPRLCPFEKMTTEWREWQRWHCYGLKVNT